MGSAAARSILPRAPCVRATVPVYRLVNFSTPSRRVEQAPLTQTAATGLHRKAERAEQASGAYPNCARMRPRDLACVALVLACARFAGGTSYGPGGCFG